MARRPDVFNQAAFEDSLRRQGCVESNISPYSSEFKLIMPLLLRGLTKEQVLILAERAQEELGLKDLQVWWPDVAKYMVGWADEQIEAYKEQKAAAGR